MVRFCAYSVPKLVPKCTIFDVIDIFNVTRHCDNLNCPSYADRTIEQIHSQHEKEKKREYNVRVLDVEKGSFTPMVFLTTVGCSPEANKHHKRIATLIADKRKEEYSEVMKSIRCRVSFNLLRSILTAIRGVRGKRTTRADPMSSVEFGLIPQGFAE